MRPIMPTVCRLSRAYHFDVRRYTSLNLNCRAPGPSISRATVFDHFSASKSPMIDTVYLCIRVSSISTTLQRVVNDTVCQRYLTFDAQLATRPKRSREPLAYTSCSADTTTTSVRELTKAPRWQLRTTHWQSARTGSRPGQPVMPIYYLEPAHDQRIRTPRTRTTMTRVRRGRTWTRRRTPCHQTHLASLPRPRTHPPFRRRQEVRKSGCRYHSACLSSRRCGPEQAFSRLRRFASHTVAPPLCRPIGAQTKTETDDRTCSDREVPRHGLICLSLIRCLSHSTQRARSCLSRLRAKQTTRATLETRQFTGA